MESHVYESYVDFTITLPVYFAFDGFVEIKYRIDSSNLNVIKFLVDGDIVMFDNDDIEEWQIYRYNVKKGSHILDWVYSKFNGVNNGEFLAAEIEYILI